MLLPKKDVDFVDLWHVNGLRETGSFSFELDGLFVPSHRTYYRADSSRESGPL